MRTSEIDSSLDVSTDVRATDPTNPARKRSSRTAVLDELRGYVDSRESVGAEGPTSGEE
jgi:hypothetical protein